MTRLLAFGPVSPLCAHLKPALRLVPVVAIVSGLTIAAPADTPTPLSSAAATADPPEAASVVTGAAAARDHTTETSAGTPDVATDQAPGNVDRDPGDYKRASLQRWRVVRPGIVKSRSGATARVAQRHTAKFQCLVDWLDEQGFRIGSMGGFAARPYGGSLHPIGAALDIDQISRNRLIRGKRYPAGTSEAASRCGLMHGDRTAWPNYPDYGHFQVAGVTRAYYRRLPPRHVFAQGDVQATTTARVSLRHRVRLAGASMGTASTPLTNALDVR